MRKSILILICSLTLTFTSTCLFSAVPEKITYQGTLRKDGAIHTGTVPMEFRITNQDGAVTYWTSGSTSVYVSAGLFRYPLGIPNESQFQSVSWQSITPYIQVIVDGSALPIEPLYSSFYSLHAKSAESIKGDLTLYDTDVRITTTTGTRGIIFQDGSFQYKAAGGATQWEVNASHIYNLNPGNVGIGVSNPGVKLDVSGTVRAAAFQGDGSNVTNIAASSVNQGSFPGSSYVFPSTLTISGPVYLGAVVKSTFTDSGGLQMGQNAGIAFSGGRITGLQTPLANDEAAGKAYVDGLTGGGQAAAVLSATQTFTGQNTFINQISVSSNLFVISGNIGIGTTGPANKLDVVAANLRGISGSNTYNSDDDYVYGIYGKATNTGVGGSIGVYGRSDGGTETYAIYGESNGPGAVAIYGYATGGAYAALFPYGNVGIGLGIGAPPGARLDVKMSPGSGTGARVTAEAGGGPPADTISALKINSTGDNLTGTSIKGIDLKVTPWGANDVSYGVYADLTPNAGDPAARFGVYVTGERNNYFSGSVGIGTTGPTHKLGVEGGIFATSSITANGGFYGDGSGLNNVSIPPSINLSTINAAATTPYGGINITSNVFVSAGNVGIGTTAPGARFQIVGTDALNTSQALNAAGLVGTGLVVTNAGNVGIGTTNPLQSLHVYGNNAIFDSSFVGIGKTNPTVELDINGDVRIMNYTGTDTILLVDANASYKNVAIGSNDGSLARLAIKGKGTDTGLTLLTQDSAGVNKVSILDNGSVGIGTTGPTHKLRVEGGIFATSSITANGGFYGDGSGLNNVSIPPSINLSTINAAATTPYGGINITSNVFVSAGNVGMGTSGPGAKLHAVETSGSNQYILITSTAGDSGSYKMVVSTTGNVGIGTASPEARLDVNGQVRASVVNAGSATTIDWNYGNVQYTSAGCGAVTFANMLEGGAYTLVVTGATSGTCTFSQSVPDTLTTFKFSPPNGATTAATTSVYTFLRAGGIIYVSWITGF